MDETVPFTAQLAYLKIDDGENKIPSILLTEEIRVDDKPPGKGLPGGDSLEGETPEEAVRREVRSETRRDINPRVLESALRFRITIWSKRTAGAMYTKYLFIVVSRDAPPVIGTITEEVNEIKRVDWFRANRLPDPKYGLPMYFSHREQLGACLRLSAQERPEYFEEFGLDAAVLATYFAPPARGEPRTFISIELIS